MRISIRSQLTILLVLASSIPLCTLSVAVWFTNHDFVLKVAASSLETAASLKAVEVADSLDVMYVSCLALAASTPMQQALARYNNGSDTSTGNWLAASADMTALLSTMGALRHTPGVQSQLFSANTTGPAGSRSVMNTTGVGLDSVVLPWSGTDGKPARLGVGDSGYPQALYPNLTISTQHDGALSHLATYNGYTFGLRSNLVLGPIMINESYALLSMTLPVVEDGSETNVLGWLTVCLDAVLLSAVLSDPVGVGRTGLTLLMGPGANVTNHFPPNILGTNNAGQTDVRFVLPVSPGEAALRHPNHSVNTANLPFPASQYPAVEAAIRGGSPSISASNMQFRKNYTDRGSLLHTHNEAGRKVAVAYATPSTTLTDWIVIVERTRSDVWTPINHLRTIILACLFSFLGFFLFMSLPIAHRAVRPIVKLREATEETLYPVYEGEYGSETTLDEPPYQAMRNEKPTEGGKNGFIAKLYRLRHRERTADQAKNQEMVRRRSRVPAKIEKPHSWIRDDVTELIDTFNAMSDELYSQYSKLEERVRERTVELNMSKTAAEAANESKTLFVANVSHELKTPLNGILGMCAVCMEDNDIQQIKTSLGIIYKSGEMLLRTLNDLLQFSSNQVGSQELVLEEREFTLSDLNSQVVAIFGRQALDNRIDLRIEIEDAELRMEESSRGAKFRDMTLWGDVHRLLQIIINLVSNSLKYTPERGSVVVIMRRAADSASLRSLLRPGLTSAPTQGQHGLLMPMAGQSGTANFINPTADPKIQERSHAPPGEDIFVEFAVRDTGQGIAEDMQDRVFEPFVQGEVGLNRKHSGTGLGLSIVAQLVSLMKGDISLTSTLDQGSTFTVKLPLRQVTSTSLHKSSLSHIPSTSSSESLKEKPPDQAAETMPSRDTPPPSSAGKQADEPSELESLQPGQAGRPLAASAVHDMEPSEPPPSLQRASLSLPEVDRKPRQGSKDDKPAKATEQHDFQNVRVLVAEDNKVNQQVIQRMLKLERILQVTIAEDGQQALDLIQAHAIDAVPYDLILMDVQMPNMDGLTSTRKIRESGVKLPIVALTAYAEKTNVEACYASGMDHFVAKPLKRQQLQEVLVKFCAPKSNAAHGCSSDDATTSLSGG